MPHALSLILYNLRDSGIIYLVCVFAIVGAFKFLAGRPKPKQFTLLGATLILVAGLGGAVINAVMYQVMVGATPTNLNDLKNYAETANTFGTISGVLHFLIGAAHAAGIACLAWAVFSDKVKVTAAKKKKKPVRRRDDEDDEDDEDEDDRPRRRRRARRDDDDEDED